MASKELKSNFIQKGRYEECLTIYVTSDKTLWFICQNYIYATLINELSHGFSEKSGTL